MIEFNKFMKQGAAIKRSFSGAIASQLNYYLKEVLKEEDLDRIVINIGTNNLTKKRQSEQEIANEIFQVVEKCHDHGINEIFVSGITCRPRYQNKIDNINKLLKDNTREYNYSFIDNSDIQEKHLWKDKLHLNEQGMINLACIFLDALNHHSLDNNYCYNSFY